MNRNLPLVLVLLVLVVSVSVTEPVLADAPTTIESLGTLEVRYRNPEAAEILLLWGIEGVSTVPQSLWPAGSRLKYGRVATPMSPENNSFVATISAPLGATVEYMLQVRRTRDGRNVDAWETANRPGGAWQSRVGDEIGVEIPRSLELATERGLPTRREFAASLTTGFVGAVALAAALCAVARRRDGRLIVVALILLAVVGLSFRLLLAWQTNQQLPDDPSRLHGDEPGYDYLAWSLVHGTFFDWPGRTPVYPLFLAASYAVFGHSFAAAVYVQAVVSTLTIPLTYIVARHFGGVVSSLLAAEVAAVDPALIAEVPRLYTEAIYIPLLLIAIIGLLKAQTVPRVARFAVAGALLGAVTLCRPTTVLWPLLVPLILSRACALRKRLKLSAVYAGAMLAVIAPWTWHNYRTYGVFIPLSLSTALLWEGSPDFYALMESQRRLVDIWSSELSASRNGGHDPMTIEGDRYFNKLATDSIARDPGTYIKYSLQKPIFLWLGNPANDWPAYDMFGLDESLLYFSAGTVAGIFAARALPIFGLISLVLIWKQRGRLAPLIAICGYFTACFSLTYAEVRLSEPLHPILGIFIGLAAVEVGHRATIWRGRW